MKYLVIATKWDADMKESVQYVAGEFPAYYLAAIFRDAYNEHFKASARIVETA